MSYSRASLAYELYRPTIARLAPMAGVVFLATVFWLGLADERGATPVTAATPSEVETLRAGDIDVPAYFFPDAATGTDVFVSPRDADCGGTVAETSDYPEGWLKP